MKNKLYKILLPIYTLVCLALAVLLIVKISAEFESLRYLKASAFVLLGFVVGAFFCTLVHELGHFVALKRRRVKILEFSSLGFKKQLKNGKMVWRFSLFDAYNGYVSFVCDRDEDCSKCLEASVSGASISTIVFVVVAMLCTMLSTLILNADAWLKLVFGAMAIYSFHFTLLNFYSFMPTSDGALLMNYQGCRDRSALILQTQSNLFAGESLQEMSDELFDNSGEKNGYYSCLRLLEENRFDEAESLVARADAFNEKTFDNQPIAFDLEKLFIASIKKDEKEVARLKDRVIEFCDDNPSPTTERVQLAYRIFSGEKQWADIIRKNFNKQSSCVLEGLFKTEKKIIELYCHED